MKVFTVFTEVLSEVLDACGEQGDLHFAGSGVVFVGTEFLDDFCFVYCSVFCHFVSIRSSWLMDFGLSKPLGPPLGRPDR